MTDSPEVQKYLEGYVKGMGEHFYQRICHDVAKTTAGIIAGQTNDIEIVKNITKELNRIAETKTNGK